MPSFHLPSPPYDAVRWFAFVLAGIVVWRGQEQLERRAVPRWLWWLAPLTAATLSLGYVAHYLRGGPRIIDATSYYLQARAYAEGYLSIPLGEPEQAILGRFLVRAHTPVPSAAVIFPPGYPAVLALGFAVGAPMLVGPVLAAGIVVATMALTGHAAQEAGVERPAVLVTFAALASVSCAALRYHTADTMAHGLAALCVTSTLWAAFRHARSPAGGSWSEGLTLGLAGGWLFATRPASAFALGLALSVGFFGDRRWRRVSAALATGTVLGLTLPLALWLAHQHNATGSSFSSAQSLYYRVSDGPPGCFRYGFGAGIGCEGEHGTFVAANLAYCYGIVAAAKTTGRRLMMHVSDGLGFAPLFVAVLVGARAALPQPMLRVLVAAVLAQWLAYAPFYFDGNYPGGGARMFADVLPVEHVLAALSLHRFRWRGRPLRAARVAAWLLGLGLLGFAIHLGAQHRQLQGREGGRPMFIPKEVEGFDGLLFVATDHGFNLAFDPASPRRVARLHRDDLDALTWDHAGRPPAAIYVHGFDGSEPRLVPWSPPLRPADAPLQIEGESLWPPSRQRESWAFPRHTAVPCVSGGRVLRIASGALEGEVRLVLPAALAGSTLTVRGLSGSGQTRVTLTLYSRGRELVAVAPQRLLGADCHDLAPLAVPMGAAGLELGIGSEGGFDLDLVSAQKNR